MKKYFSLFLLAGCAAILTLGLIRLFKLRFEAGDVYPAYSSLRSDPLGTMAFYESLGKVPGIFGTPRFQRRESFAGGAAHGLPASGRFRLRLGLGAGGFIS